MDSAVDYLRQQHKAKEQAEFSRKYSETNPLKKLDWKVTDERILFEQVRHCLVGPLYTGGLGQTASVAPPLSAALTPLGGDQKILSIKKEPMLSGFFSL